MYIHKKIFLTRCIALWVILALMVTLVPTAPYAVGQEAKKPDGGGTTDTPQEAPEQQAEAPPERVSDGDEEQEESEEEETPAPTLIGLTVSGTDLNETFDSAVTTYTADVAHDSETVTISATPMDDTATVAFTDTTDADTEEDGHQVNLTEGENTVTITVTAQDGVTTQTYTLTVTRAAEEEPTEEEEQEEADENEEQEDEEETGEETPAPTLSGLTVSDTDLNEPFDAETTAYTADVAHDSETVTISATSTDNTATVTYDPTDADTEEEGQQVNLTEGENTVTITVTAEDTTQTYTLTITRAAEEEQEDEEETGEETPEPTTEPALEQPQAQQQQQVQLPDDDDTSDTQGAPSGPLILVLKTSSDSHRHGTITTVTALPGSPTSGAVIRFTESASSLANTVDTDGSTAKTTAAANDMFRYNGTKWVFMGNGVTTAGISSDVDGITSDDTPTFNVSNSATFNSNDGSLEEASFLMKKDQGCAGLSKPSGDYIPITRTQRWSHIFTERSMTNSYDALIGTQNAGMKCLSVGWVTHGQNTSNWSELLEVTIDTGATTPTVAITSGAGTGNPTVRVSGLESGGAVAQLFSDSGCGTAISGVSSRTGASETSKDLTTTTIVAAGASIYAKQTDVAGNGSACSDAVLNAVPSAAVSGIDLKTGSDTGTQDDSITSDTTAPALGFTQVSGATITVRYRKVGGSWTTIQSGSITATGAAGTITLPNLTAGDGTYEVEITQDDDGNGARSPTAATYIFTLDTTAPTVIVSSTPALPSGTPTKFSQTGGVTITLENEDKFGTATSLSADGMLMAVGVPNDDDKAGDSSGNDRGAVYLFQKSGATWQKIHKFSDHTGSGVTGTRFTTAVTDVNLSNSDHFGSGVSLSADGTLLAVGARGDGTGAVYLFKKSSTTWQKIHKFSNHTTSTEPAVRFTAAITDVDIGGSGWFGTAVSLSASGEVLAVGARDDGSSSRGAVYLFEKTDGSWSQSLKISDNNGGAGLLDITLDARDYFGSDVSLSADGALLAVGADGDDDGSSSRGAVYLFEKASGSWTKTLKISQNGGGNSGLLHINLDGSDYFGSAVSLAGTALAASAYSDDDGGTDRGAIYLFQKTDGSWTKTLKISDNGGSGTGLLDINLDNDDRFGSAVALSADGTVLAAGAPDDDDGGSNSGAVYLYGVSPPTIASASTVTAFDSEGSSAMKWVKISDTTCTATQFTGDAGTVYTEGSAIVVTDTADNGKRFCFRVQDAAGNIGFGISPAVTVNPPVAPPTSAFTTLKIKSDAANDTGSSQDDNITKNTSPTFVVGHTTEFGAPTGQTKAGIQIGWKSGTCPAAVPTQTTAQSIYSAGTGWNYYGTGLLSVGAKQTSVEVGRLAGQSVLSAGTICILAYYNPNTINTGSTVVTASYTMGEITIDTTKPVLTVFRIWHGNANTVTFRINATDDALPITGRTKDNVTSANCTDSTDTTGGGWTDYTPGTETGTAHDTNGRCVIITDATGNSKKQHLSDFTAFTPIPKTPVGLIDTWTATGVTLNWTDPSDSVVTGYQWQQCDGTGANCGSWTNISGSNATTVSYAFTGLTANTGYTMKLRATYATGNSIAVSAVGMTGTVYDTDGDGLIDINTIQKLNAIRYDLNGDGAPKAGQESNYTAAFPNAATHLGCPGPCTGYELTADLDLNDETAGIRTDDTYYNSGAGWEPIGADSANNRFTAIFNGRGFVIDNLFINRGSTGTQALFAATETGAKITAVGLRDVSVTGANGSAALVGASKTGTVINTSFSTGTVAGAWGTGGLVGHNEGTVEASYSAATVSGTISVGGLVGNSQNSGASIKNSYAYGAVTQSGSQHLGGLVGHSHTNATITDSYWDTTVTAAAGTTTTGATGKTTTQLQTPVDYTGIYATWDDSDVGGTSANDTPWNFGESGQYPALSFGGHRTATQWSAEANLTALTVSVGTLSPSFTESLTAYTMEVSPTTASLTVTPTLHTATSSVTVNGNTVTSGSPSAAIALTAGAVTDITIVVTATSGSTNTYTIAVTRLKDYDDDDDGLIDIRTHQQLNAVRWDLDGNGTPASGQGTNYTTAFPSASTGMGCKLTDHDNDANTADKPTCTGYELRADIDLDTDEDGKTWTGTEASPSGDSGDAYYNSGSGWAPIGHQPSTAFSGTFKGNGYTIKNLFINRTATYTGLFGFVGRPSKSHTRIEGVGLKNAYVKGGGSTGALVGRNEKPVTASWVTGAVRGANGVGGLIGLNTSTVTASYSLASVTATNTVGGLIGQQENGGIVASYAGGKVSTAGATKGGLVASKSGTAYATNSYYNSDTTTLASSALGTAKTDKALRTPTGYTGIYLNWNVDVGGTNATDDPWSIVAGNYPVLDYGAGASVTTQRNEQPAVPAKPTIALQSPTTTPHTDKTPTFRVTTLTTGATITLHTGSDCSGTALTTTPTTVTVASSDTTKDIDSTFVVGSYTIFAKQTKDNIPVCSSGISFEIKGKPAAPGNIAIAPGDTEVTVSWDNPNNPTITSYEYKRKVGTGNYDANWTMITGVGASDTSHTFTGLTNGTAYQYKIRAVNAAGNGAESETAAATPVATISAAPASPTLASDSGSITPYTGTGTHRTRDTTPTIAFTAVANAVTTAKYRQGTSGVFSNTGITYVGTGSTTARTATLPTLSTNGTYQVEITQTESGKTAKTVTYSFMLDTVSPTVTPAVSKTGHTQSGGTDYLSIGDTITVTFTFDEDMPATPVLTGKFRNNATDIPASGGNHHTIAPARTSATVQTLKLTVRDAGPDVADGNLKYQLTNGTALTDLAGNALGAQTVTTIANTVIDTTKPTLTAFRVGSGNSATYRVTATDASSVTGRTKDNVATGSCTDNTDTTGGSWTDYTPGADTGTAHDTAGRCVIITDTAGNSKKQHLLDSTVMAVIPTAPTGLTGTWGTAGITLNWTDPSESSITKYQYQQCDSAGVTCGSWTDIPSSGATTVTHPITGLTANTGYSFKLRAVNANGDGTAASITGTTGTIYDTDTDGLIDINTIQKLNAIRYDLNGDGVPKAGQESNYTTVFPNAATHLGCPGPCTGYELTADLDFDTDDADIRTDDTYHNSGAGWEPIGADSAGNRFTATFNGNGFVIDNLLINRSSTGTQALFAATETGAKITAVGMRDVNVAGTNGSAALVGASKSGTVISASFSTGSITGAWAAGGLVGYNEGTVEASYSSATVSGTTAVGGLVGNSQNSGASIKNSYAYGAVTQSGTTHLGGLVGHNHTNATITDSYWDTEVTTAAGVGTTGAVGKTTTQLQTPVDYTGIYATWDDSDIGGTSANDAPWDFGRSSQYPALTFGGHRTATQRPAFTLDITGNGTANYLDAIVHYYYAQNPIDQSAGGAVMANFINANDSPTNTENQTDTAAIYTTMQDSATTRDFTGNGTTNYLDAIVHYYYAQNPIDQSAGGAVMANFINANDSPTNTENQTNTATIYALLQNLDL